MKRFFLITSQGCTGTSYLATRLSQLNGFCVKHGQYSILKYHADSLLKAANANQSSLTLGRETSFAATDPSATFDWLQEVMPESTHYGLVHTFTIGSLFDCREIKHFLQRDDLIVSNLLRDPLKTFYSSYHLTSSSFLHSRSMRNWYKNDVRNIYGDSASKRFVFEHFVKEYGAQHAVACFIAGDHVNRMLSEAHMFGSVIKSYDVSSVFESATSFVQYLALCTGADPALYSSQIKHSDSDVADLFKNKHAKSNEAEKFDLQSHATAVLQLLTNPAAVTCWQERYPSSFRQCFGSGSSELLLTANRSSELLLLRKLEENIDSSISNDISQNLDMIQTLENLKLLAQRVEATLLKIEGE